MKKSHILFLTIAVFFVGCTDLDDILYDRISEDAYTADPVLRMATIYRPMQDHLDWGGWWFAQELTTDALVIPTRGEHWDDGGKWVALHRHSWTPETEAIQAMWGRYFNGVVEANKFIEEQTEFVGDPIVDAAIAKAKILRAYYYYLLICNYGDVPLVITYMDAPERPFAEDRAVIFEAIVKDIEDNVVLLDQDQTSKTAITAASAYALLAKLYLNAEVYSGTPQWAKAQAAIEKVMEFDHTLEAHPLAPFVTNNHNSPENIWIIPYNENNYQGFNLHMRTLHYQSNLTFNMTAGPWNGMALVPECETCNTPAFFHLYDENDLRREGFLWGLQYDYQGNPIIHSSGDSLIFPVDIPELIMSPGDYTDTKIEFAGVRANKFEVAIGAQENLSNAFPIFRLADFYLMMAEVLVRQGANGDDYLNTIRQRAGLEPITGADLDDILEERAREMFFEGHRRQDLIRFGKFGEPWWEKPATGPERETFPIPDWVIESNPNLSN